MYFLFSTFIFIHFFSSNLSANQNTLSILNDDKKIEFNNPTYIKAGTKTGYYLFADNALFKTLKENSRLKVSELTQCAKNLIDGSLIDADNNKSISLELAFTSCEKYYDPQLDKIESPIVMVSSDLKKNIILFRDSPPSKFKSTAIINSSKSTSYSNGLPRSIAPLDNANCTVTNQFSSDECKKGLKCLDPSCNTCFVKSQETGIDLIPSANIGSRLSDANYFSINEISYEDIKVLLDKNIISKKYVSSNTIAECIPCPPKSIRDTKNYCKYIDNNCDPFLEDYDYVQKKCNPKFCPSRNTKRDGKCLPPCNRCKTASEEIKEIINNIELLKPQSPRRTEYEEINLYTAPAFILGPNNTLVFKYPEKFETYKRDILGKFKQILNTYEANFKNCESATSYRSTLDSCASSKFIRDRLINDTFTNYIEKETCPRDEFFNIRAIPGPRCEPKACTHCARNRSFAEEESIMLSVAISARPSLTCDYSVFKDALKFLYDQRKLEITSRLNECLQTRNGSTCKSMPNITASNVTKYIKTQYGIECNQPRGSTAGGSK